MRKFILIFMLVSLNADDSVTSLDKYLLFYIQYWEQYFAIANKEVDYLSKLNSEESLYS